MGPRFESVKAHQWPVGQAAKTAASHAANVGSIPARVTIFDGLYAPLAQLVEQLTLNQWVFRFESVKAHHLYRVCARWGPVKFC